MAARLRAVLAQVDAGRGRHPERRGRGSRPRPPLEALHDEPAPVDLDRLERR